MEKEELENRIIELLNEADNTLNEEEFNQIAESIIDYIDEIGRNKKT
jgi:hypothetical protein